MKDKLVYLIIAGLLAATFIIPVKLWVDHANTPSASTVSCTGSGTECWKLTYKVPSEYQTLNEYLRANPDAEPVKREPITRY